MTLYFYRRPGQRGRPSKVWISSQHQDVRAAAEAVLGPLAVFEPVAEASVPADVHEPPPAPEPASEPVRAPEPAPAPEPLAAQPVPPPVLGVLVITQADSIVRLPVAPPPAPESLPPLPEPDVGTMDFWDDHEFFRPPAWTLLPWARTARNAESDEEGVQHG